MQFKLNLPKETIISMQKALSLEPENTSALYFLGRSYEQIGERKKAREIYENILKIDPDYGDDVKQRIEALTEKREAVAN